MGEKKYLRGKVKLLGVCPLGAEPPVQKPRSEPLARHGRQRKSIPGPGRSGPTTLSSAGPSGLAGGNGWRGRIYKHFPICSFRSHHFLLLHPNTDLLPEKCLQQMQAVTSVEVSKPWQPSQRLSPALNPLGRATWLIKCKKTPTEQTKKNPHRCFLAHQCAKPGQNRWAKMGWCKRQLTQPLPNLLSADNRVLHPVIFP